jgi:hypothetical protein
MRSNNLQLVVLAMAALGLAEGGALAHEVESSNLEFGSFFGSNWLDVEQEARTQVEESLAFLSEECSLSSQEQVSKGVYPLSCGVAKAAYCGFNPELNENGVVFNIIFYQSLGIRHTFTNYEATDGDHRYGRQLDICLSECIEEPQDSMLEVSEKCLAASAEVRRNIHTLNDLEDIFDQYETEFRGNIIMISLLSALASVLVIYVSSSMSSDKKKLPTEQEHALCTTICVSMNWMAGLAMLGFVALSCPMFLVVILPPFAVIQVLYHVRCAASRDETHLATETDDNSCHYELLLDQDDDSRVPVVKREVFAGIPIQVV